MYVCVCVCMYVCMYICMYVYMYVCMYVLIIYVLCLIKPIFTSGRTHLRRIVISLLVYVLLMLLLLWIPMMQVKALTDLGDSWGIWGNSGNSGIGESGGIGESAESSGIGKTWGIGGIMGILGEFLWEFWGSFGIPRPDLRLRTWYMVPALQLPAELFAAHVCFLTLLDRNKDLIGRMQHSAFVYLADFLGIHILTHIYTYTHI
jgi:hypothetical protein